MQIQEYLPNRCLSIYKLTRKPEAHSRPLPRGPQPLDPAEFEIAHIALGKRTISLVKLPGQCSAANPIARFVLLKNCRVERIHAAQLENYAAVQQAVTLQGIFIS